MITESAQLLGGRILLPFLPDPWVWSTEPFGNDRLALGGVLCRMLPLARLLADKQAPRPDPEDAAQDVADYAALRQVAPDREARHS